MIRIRPYAQKDREAVEKICLVTADEELRTTREKEEGVLAVWCHYYIDREPQNCFVAVNEEDTAIGYILCAQDYKSWRETFLRDYVEGSENPYIREAGRDSVLEGAKYAAYPAHMHIDILPEYQRIGIGGRLTECLRDHLKEEGVTGLMLVCSADNEKGLGFYRKAGFRPLRETEAFTVFGMPL